MIDMNTRDDNGQQQFEQHQEQQWHEQNQLILKTFKELNEFFKPRTGNQVQPIVRRNRATGKGTQT